MFSNNECLTQPSDLIRLWLHECQRVYGDKLTEEKDIDAFSKLQLDIFKKNFEVIQHNIFLYHNKYYTILIKFNYNRKLMKVSYLINRLFIVILLVELENQNTCQ